MPASRSVPCNKKCGTMIHFEEGYRSPKGTPIPLGPDGQPHQCPNDSRYQAETNPIQQGLQQGRSGADTRDENIKAAQRQRKKEHNELMRAYGNLYKIIEYAISVHTGKSPDTIQNEIGYEDPTSDEEA